jgi:proteasome lid subunit RPN8/RPN11
MGWEMKFEISATTLNEIKDIVYRTDVETGVRLIGIVEDARYIVLHVIGPGQKAKQEIYEYECDNDHAERQFARLLEGNPNLKFLGELHVHPGGFPTLSGTDLCTVRKILEEYPFFIAGVIERHPFSIRPILFTKDRSELMEVSCDIQPKPERKRSFVREIRGRYRLWKRWLRHRRNVREGWPGEAHSDRS